MPANPISFALNWLATHLVAFSLVGFLFAAILVFGPIEMPGTGPSGERKTTPASVEPRPGPGMPPVVDLRGGAASGLEPAEMPFRTLGEGGDEAQPEGPGRRGPRLIGGSLPVYGQVGEEPSIPDSKPGAFRPPGDADQRDPVQLSREDYIQQARRAFWNGEFEESEAAYMTVISRYPADPDAFGELGNLYQSMGKSDRALDAYYEAAVRLKAVGDTEKLKEIMDLLAREGDERAKNLIP